MRYLPCLLLTLCGLLSGCDSGASSQVDAAPQVDETASKTLSLAPADLEKLSSWKETSIANAKLTEMLAEIMSEITDQQSAEASIEKLRQLAPKFAAINRAEKAFGDPTSEDRKLVMKNLAAANEKFNSSYTPLMQNEQLKAIVSDAIDDAYVGNVTE